MPSSSSPSISSEVPTGRRMKTSQKLTADTSVRSTVQPKSKQKATTNGAEDQAGGPGPAARHGDAHRGERGKKTLAERAWDRDGADGEEIFQVKVQTDAEHEQDDADLGELRGEVRIRLKAGRVFAERDAGGEVADDGGEPATFRYQTTDQRGGKPEGERGDQRDVMHGVVTV